MTNKEFAVASYNAYVAYVDYIEGNRDMQSAIDAMFPAFYEYNRTLTPDEFVRVITVYMTTYGTANGEKARKIKSVSTMRKLIKTEWETVVTSSVVHKEAKSPDETAQARNEKRADEAIKVLESAGIDITDDVRKAMYSHTWGKAVVK